MSDENELPDFVVKHNQREVAFYQEKLLLFSQLQPIELPFTQSNVQFAMDWMYRA